jgi:hypothetical protein
VVLKSRARLLAEVADIIERDRRLLNLSYSALTAGPSEMQQDQRARSMAIERTN